MENICIISIQFKYKLNLSRECVVLSDIHTYNQMTNIQLESSYTNITIKQHIITSGLSYLEVIISS